MVMEVLWEDNVKAYISSRMFKDGSLPLETVMCYNFKGGGNFSNNALGIPSNACLLHGTGMIPYFEFNVPHS